ncbi:hypothetical protein TNCV_3206671 [Trichonephila clavipes]|nr:hypothetical protein TNCV_3206671 [Trichonephila clavipes]
MTLIDDLRLRMPLRRNRRQYEQLTDFDRGRIIGLREAEGRVYRRGRSGRPRNTNDREDRAIRRVATSAPTTFFYRFNATYLLPDIQCHQEKP